MLTTNQAAAVLVYVSTRLAHLDPEQFSLAQARLKFWLGGKHLPNFEPAGRGKPYLISAGTLRLLAILHVLADIHLPFSRHAAVANQLSRHELWQAAIDGADGINLYLITLKAKTIVCLERAGDAARQPTFETPFVTVNVSQIIRRVNEAISTEVEMAG